jgi:hypothetical protein
VISAKKPEPVGSGECVALVQDARGARAPVTSKWNRGDPVQGEMELKPGTAIATFVKGSDGKYHYSGHAAIYLGQDEKGIRVIDQWNNRDESSGVIKSQKPPSERVLPFGRPGINGGDEYHVIQ